MGENPERPLLLERDDLSRQILAVYTSLMDIANLDFAGIDSGSSAAGRQDADPASSVVSSRPEGIVGNLKALGSSVLDTLASCASPVIEGASSVGNPVSNTAIWKAGKDFLSSIGDFINPIDAPHGCNCLAGSIMVSAANLLPETYQLPCVLFGVLSVVVGSNYCKRPSEVMKDMQEQSGAGQGRAAPDDPDVLSALLFASVLAGVSHDEGDSQSSGGARGSHSIDSLFQRDASLSNLSEIE